MLPRIDDLLALPFGRHQYDGFGLSILLPSLAEGGSVLMPKPNTSRARSCCFLPCLSWDRLIQRCFLGGDRSHDSASCPLCRNVPIMQPSDNMARIPQNPTYQLDCWDRRRVGAAERRTPTRRRISESHCTWFGGVSLAHIICSVSCDRDTGRESGNSSDEKGREHPYMDKYTSTQDERSYQDIYVCIWKNSQRWVR